jgi:hypothetical protein
MSDLPDTPSSAPDAVNDQVRDAARQAALLLEAGGRPFAQAAATQMVAHALGLAAHNLVAQQQHGYMLRNALTSAAAQALLQGKREEAEAVLKLAESRLVTTEVAEELGRLLAALKAVLETFPAGHVSVPSA